MRSDASWPDCTLALKFPFLNNRRKCQGDTRIICLAMVSSSQIKGYLALYLSNGISLEQFEDWFVPSTRDIRATGSKAAMALTFAIEGTLSEYLSQLLDKREMS